MKKRTEKQMVIESVYGLLTMLPSLGIAAVSWSWYQELYVRLSLLCLIVMGILYSWIYGRCLVDKAYRKKRLIERNDERYHQLVRQASYVTTVVLIGVLSVILGFVLAYDADGSMLMVPLKVLIIPIWAMTIVVFFGSLLILEKIG